MIRRNGEVRFRLPNDSTIFSYWNQNLFPVYPIGTAIYEKPSQGEKVKIFGSVFGHQYRKIDEPDHKYKVCRSEDGIIRDLEICPHAAHPLVSKGQEVKFTYVDQNNQERTKFGTVIDYEYDDDLGLCYKVRRSKGKMKIISVPVVGCDVTATTTQTRTQAQMFMEQDYAEEEPSNTRELVATPKESDYDDAEEEFIEHDYAEEEPSNTRELVATPKESDYDDAEEEFIEQDYAEEEPSNTRELVIHSCPSRGKRHVDYEESDSDDAEEESSVYRYEPSDEPSDEEDE